MMKHRLIKWMGIVGCLLSLCACGMLADDDKNIDTAFQDNGPMNTDNPDAGFRVLEVFDGRGSLEDIWDSIDAKQTNPRLTCTVDHLTDDFVTFSTVAAGILRDDSQPLSLLLSDNASALLGLVRDESAPFFVESPPDIGAFYSQTPGDYADAFYAFLDALWEGDQRPGDLHMAAMARKVVSRMLDKKDALTILADMQELIDDIGEAEFDRDFNDLATLLGKLMIRADYPLWIDAAGDPVNRDVIDPALDENLGAGNAVAGVNTLINWMNTMMADPTARSFFYEVIRETAAVFDPADASTNADKVKTLIQTLESRFTENGDVYTADPLYSSDTAAIYSDTELGLTVREFMPYLAQLLARSDRDISMVDTAEGEEPVYLLREMVDALHGIGFDPDTLSVEDSITMMMRHDLLGRDRTDEASGAFPASMLESLVFLTGATTHFGFADGGASGETAEASNPITQHGHGGYTEAMTLNDSLISMTTYKTLNLLGIYDISLKDTDKNYLSRSNVPFTTANRSDYQYDANQNYPILRALAGPSSGDYGTPDGGNRTGQVPAQNGYTPFNPTGVGETQLAAWTVNWAVRSCFGGEGPYYYADPDADTVTMDGRTWYVYLRPDGRIYALVNKDNPDSWEYLYPTDERDAEDPDTAVLSDYNGLRQRFNRYKSTWYSDYYMY
ncbi:hypothetical protein, partial [Desulfatiferula olefinivorans]